MTEQQNLSQAVSPVDSINADVGGFSSQEEMIPKSRVTQLAHEKYNQGSTKGYEKGIQEERARWQQQQTQQPSLPHQSHPASEELSKLSKDVDDLKAQLKKKNEDEQAAHLRIHFSNVINQMMPKIEDAKKKHTDFEEVVKPEFVDASLLELVNGVDNGGEVLYEMVKTPEKMGQIMALRHPELMQRAVRNLSQTLKTNQASASVRVPRDPISQIQASNVKSADNGTPLTIAELRRKYTR